MDQMTTGSPRIEDLQAEFIPPIELPETHGLAWERQLAAVEAWQAAGGDADPACEPAGGIGGTHASTMRTITRMNTVLQSLRDRLQQIQLEAANVAIAELARREAGSSAAPHPEDAFSPLGEEHQRRIDALLASCFDLLGSARTALTAIPGVGERRRRSIDIDFPDRRAAA